MWLADWQASWSGVVRGHLQAGQELQELGFRQLPEVRSLQHQAARLQDAALAGYVAGRVQVVPCHHAHLRPAGQAWNMILAEMDSCLWNMILCSQGCSDIVTVTARLAALGPAYQAASAAMLEG